MQERRTQKLHELLKRLGQAVHGSVVQSDEVRGCLKELLEASLACREDRGLETDEASVRIHIDPQQGKVSYRIDARDAEILGSLGISPSRHRSASRQPRSEPDDEPPR